MADCWIVPTVAQVADCLAVPMDLMRVGSRADTTSIIAAATRVWLVAASGVLWIAG